MALELMSRTGSCVGRWCTPGARRSSLLEGHIPDQATELRPHRGRPCAPEECQRRVESDPWRCCQV